MKLTVLVDNNTFIDEYYCGEPAVCYHIEDSDDKLLLDTGYSDLFIKNAQALHIDLSSISTIVFSHGHDDHTRGLKYLVENNLLKGKQIIAHPDTFKQRSQDGRFIGAPLSETNLNKYCRLSLSKKPIRINEHLTFLGEIPSLNDFEKRKAFGTIINGDQISEDRVMDDTALVYNNGNGLFIITGCSHSGICNIIEYTKLVCNENKILGVIGGFHLFGVSPQLKKTINYFQENNIRQLYPCHCVSFDAKAEIHKYIPIHEVGVGLTITIE